MKEGICIEKTLLKEKDILEKMLLMVNIDLKKAPKGILRTSVSNNTTQYYLVKQGETSKRGKYLSKKKMDFIKSLAQRDYNQEIKGLIEERINLINQYLALGSFKSVYDSMLEKKKLLVHPIELFDEEFLEEWECEEYYGLDFEEDAPEIYTQKGERVRSKSEKIIADFLYQCGIPYKYEHPLVLGGMTVYPDFTLLDLKNRKEIYLEHLGMMDDLEYMEKALKKMNSYQREGYYLGEQLMITYETMRLPFDSRSFEGMIKARFGV